ncbi:MAG TPA: hypothetical protein VFV66_31495 [Nonomuraea sp.]|nr:hypothetical protein [Nonomuraea sp.]
MRSRSRRIVTATVIAGGLTLVAAPAQAITDPVHTATCLAGSATEITTLIDPSAPGIPSEIPAVSCLQP